MEKAKVPTALQELDEAQLAQVSGGNFWNDVKTLWYDFEAAGERIGAKIFGRPSYESSGTCPEG